jgi:60 kDa SS-A/Ro ribonucleoprotein
MRFNTPNTNTTKTVNYAGGEAFAESPKLAFTSLLLTSFMKDQFYRSADESISQVATLIDQIPDKRFAAKAAIYARTKFGMRSVSHVVAGEIAKKVKGETWTKSFFNRIVYRPDDMTEILAYYYQFANNEPNALRKGFAQALGRFDEYQLAKYKKEGAAVSLIDVANVVHPKHSEAIEKLIKGTLPTPETWETKLSASKGDEKLKKEAWVFLIKERKIGYFALLRNLRNIYEQSPEIIPDAVALLTDEKFIRKSLVLPFRFMTAGRTLQNEGVNNTDIYYGLSKALDISLANIPKFDGKTLVVVDHSGSMDSTGSSNSMTYFEIGALFGIAMAKVNNADFMYFGNTAKYFGLNSIDSTATLVSLVKGLNNYGNPDQVGHGTNFHAMFQEANKVYDRIVIFSDMQGWIGYQTPTSSFNEYKKRTGANPFVYSFDLAGYGSLQFPENNIFAIAGFSEKIFDVMKLLEQDRNALIAEIEKVEL